MSDSGLQKLGTTVANGLRKRVSSLVEGELDKDALAELLAAIHAMQTVTRGIADAERHLREEERRKDTARAGMHEAGPDDSNRLRERIAQCEARIEHLSGLRDELTANLTTLAKSLQS